jgi:hypothetical protein
MCDNCMVFNQPDTEFHKSAKNIKKRGNSAIKRKQKTLNAQIKRALKKKADKKSDKKSPKESRKRKPQTQLHNAKKSKLDHTLQISGEDSGQSKVALMSSPEYLANVTKMKRKASDAAASVLSSFSQPQLFRVAELLLCGCTFCMVAPLPGCSLEFSPVAS